MVILVEPATMTGPDGDVDTTVKVDLFPISAIFGTMMSADLTRN